MPFVIILFTFEIFRPPELPHYEPLLSELLPELLPLPELLLSELLPLPELFPLSGAVGAFPDDFSI